MDSIITGQNTRIVDAEDKVILVDEKLEQVKREFIEIKELLEQQT